MLYVFFVDTGTMLHLDMNLALETVENLKQNISKQFRIPEEKQVLLISGGESLNPRARVCSYSAGTDTNPIFLFSKSHLEGEDNPPVSSTEFGTDTDLSEQVEASLSMPSIYTTVVARAQLAKELYDQANRIIKDCETLVHQQHLQQQGWAAVVANLEDTTQAFRSRACKFEENYNSYLSTRNEYVELLQNFSDDLSVLAKIPVLPALVPEDDSTTDIFTDENNSLLNWISSKDNQSSLEQVAEVCIRGLQQFDARTFESVQKDVAAALDRANNSTMKEVKGLEERLSGLEQLMYESKMKVQEQKDQAAAFQQNQARAGNLGDPSILPDLCSSHRKQLQVMQKTHQQLRDIRRRCICAKEELSYNLHARLRWIAFVERSMCEVNSRLMIYHENLKRLKCHLEVVQQIHLAPKLYFAAISEVVRRKSFSDIYLQWSTSLSQQSREMHTQEISVRKTFYSQLSSHFLLSLFRGMEDYPPSFATEAPVPFDTDLPPIRREDVERLKQQLPELANYLHIADVAFMPRLDSLLTPEGDSQGPREALSSSAPALVNCGLPETKRVKSDDDTTLCSSGTVVSRDGHKGLNKLLIPEEPEDFVKELESEAETDEFEKLDNVPEATDRALFEIPEDDDDDGGISEAKHRRVDSYSANIEHAQCPTLTEDPQSRPLDDELQQQQNRLQVVEGVLQAVCNLDKEKTAKLHNDIDMLRQEVNEHRDDLKRYIAHVWSAFLEAVAGVSRNMTQEQAEAVECAVASVRQQHENILSEFRSRLEKESAELTEAQNESRDYQLQLKNNSLRLENLQMEFERELEDLRARNQDEKNKMVLEHELELDSTKEDLKKILESKENELRELKELHSDSSRKCFHLNEELISVRESMGRELEQEKEALISRLKQENVEAVDTAVQQERKTMQMEIQRLQVEWENRLQFSCKEAAANATSTLENQLQQSLKEQQETLEAEWNQRIKNLTEELEKTHNDEVVSLKTRLQQMEKELEIGVERVKLGFEQTLAEARSTWEKSREDEMNALRDQLAIEHRNEMEALRSRLRLATSSRSPISISPTCPSTPILEASSLVRVHPDEQSDLFQSSVGEQPTDTMKFDEEIARLRQQHQEELNVLRSTLLAEKQVSFNEAVKKVVEEKDKIIEELKQRESALRAQQESDRILLQKLAAENRRLLETETQLQKYQELDKANRTEVDRLDAELTNAQKKIEHLVRELEFHASTGEVAGGLITSVIPIENQERLLELENTLRFREEEVAKLQTKIMELSMTSSAATLFQQDKVSILSCNIGDLVLLCYNEKHENYLAFLVCPVYHFLHADCLEVLGLKPVSGESRKSWVLAEVTEKEYCQAKKSQNRFRVPIGTKFYRVRAKPWDKEPVIMRENRRSICASSSVPSSPTASQ